MTKAPQILLDALRVYKGEITNAKQRKTLRDEYRDKLTADDWYQLLEYMMENKHNLTGIEYKSLMTKIDKFADFLDQHNLRDWEDVESTLKGKNLTQWYTHTWSLFTSALEVAWKDHDGTTLHSLFDIKNFLV